MIAAAPGGMLSPVLCIVYRAMVKAHTGGRVSRGVRAAVLVALASVGLPASAAATPAAAGLTITPQRIAIVVFENKDYDNSLDPTDRRFAVGNPAAPFLNGTVIPESLSLVPTPSGCDHPAGDAAGVAVTACRSGMFQSYRNELGFRIRASAPEYAWMVMGTDANVRDGSFPSGLNSGEPEGGIVGYTPGHNDTSGPVYDLFGYMEANSVGFQVYQEDYPGGATDCSTVRFSDIVDKSAGPPMFYARKHSPLLLTWSQSPDALVVNDGPGGAEDLSPATQPSPAACEARVHDFPGNVPNATTQVQRNFTGDERFGRITFVVPSMCHSGHNSNRVCLGSDTDGRGGMEGIDRWLEVNLEGLRRDVGQNGVVILTFDEDHTADGAGVVAPLYTGIVPGLGPAGTPGVLAAPGCDPMPATGCMDTTHIYDHSSTARSLIEAAGGSCAVFDNTSIYQGQTTTARQNCSAATPLPLAVIDSTP
jgi:hypothetical protein